MSTKTSKFDADLSPATVDKIREAFGLNTPSNTPIFKTAYDGLNADYSDQSGIYFDPEDPLSVSMTKQAFRDECDINNILESFERTGAITHYNDVQPKYGDFSNPVDYQTAMHIVLEAHTAFENLPAKIREKFHNNPEEFLEFCSQDKNRDELIALGLIEAPPSPQDAPDGSQAAPAGGDPQRAHNAGGGSPPASA